MSLKTLELEELVRLAQAGDRSAFGELVERCQPIVLAAARSRQRDSHEADELAQEVFLHAMRKIGQLREPACFVGWLRKITVRVAINRGKRRALVVATENEVLQQHADRGAGPLDDLLKSEQREKVRSAVAGLRPIDRDALAAFYLKGKSLVQIADELAVPLGTVKRRLHVARQRLQSVFESGGSSFARPGRAEAGVVVAQRPRQRSVGSRSVKAVRPSRELVNSDTGGSNMERATTGDGPRPATPARGPRFTPRGTLAVA